ncbi:glycosyltransferase family 2 protein [Virgisporangium aurantiacum]|uniref:glycosyltransferase family 2 protein n=1 Tax=Virgisporangium aurantiacum TaxID=175570 RepID=UPI001EF3C816|nr:glycosyltransferase family 2 protein [Virgisporangium aurantiacum]
MNHAQATPADGLSWRPLQRSTRVAVSIALVVTIFYVLFLLNPEYRGNTWLWIVVLLAEGVTVFNALAMWWTVLAYEPRPDAPEVYTWRRKLATRELAPTIDVLITVYGEPLEIVLVTIRAARDMDVAHRTWVLDDGDSDLLRAACAEEGVDYLRRTEHSHAKAGNINAALKRTTGEFVVILDADHVPSPDFLLRALPHMHDPLVAFAQTPQAFPAARGLVATGAAESQRIFYELVLPGKNYFNAVFCVGTNVIFRRRALDELNGMYTASNSEDIWTSIELHRRGWRSVFVPETLARGLAPDSLLTYFKQQFRWAYGAFEVLLRGGLFRRKGLTMDQRFQYVLAGVNYLLSVAVVVFMFLPAVYLLFGISPIRADTTTWLVHYVPFYLLIVLVTVLQVGGFRLAAIVTSIGAAPVHVRALFMVLLRRKAGWTATNAGSGGLPGVELVLPHVALLLVNLMAVGVGLNALTMRGADTTGIMLSLVWACIYVLVLGRVIGEAVFAPRHIKERLERRKAGAMLSRALPWPSRTGETDEVIDLTVEQTSRPTSPASRS